MAGGYNNYVDDDALGNGGAGTQGVWDIITGTAFDLGGRIVAAFMSLDANGGTMAAMAEETTASTPQAAGKSSPVAAKYLGYTYPQYVIFEGRYTTLQPTLGCTFKVWYLQ